MKTVAIVGLGLMGQKRISAILSQPKKAEIISLCDIDEEKTKKVAEQVGAKAYINWEEMLASEKPDILVVSVPNALAFQICQSALKKGIHIFCEKPLGKNSKEAACLYLLARSQNLILKVGFSLRFHPAIEQAWEKFQAGEIGQFLFARAIYGHGGRPGYEKEWRAFPELAGGGELLDQGVHLIDLFRWFFGEISEVYGYTSTSFWKTSVEDNAFCLLKTFNGQCLMMHASWTQWKNKFNFEVFGEKGYIIIDGLGGNYGEEKLIYGRKKESIPEEKKFVFSHPEMAFQREWDEFLQAIEEKREVCGSGWDGFMANFIAEAIYESSREKKPVYLPRESELKQSLTQSLG